MCVYIHIYIYIYIYIHIHIYTYVHIHIYVYRYIIYSYKAIHGKVWLLGHLVSKTLDLSLLYYCSKLLLLMLFPMQPLTTHFTVRCWHRQAASYCLLPGSWSIPHITARVSHSAFHQRQQRPYLRGPVEYQTSLAWHLQ